MRPSLLLPLSMVSPLVALSRWDRLSLRRFPNWTDWDTDWALAALISNPIGGAFVPNAETYSFWEMQLFAGVMMAAGSTGYVVVWIHLRRVKAKERVEDV